MLGSRRNTQNVTDEDKAEQINLKSPISIASKMAASKGNRYFDFSINGQLEQQRAEDTLVGDQTSRNAMNETLKFISTP